MTNLAEDAGAIPARRAAPPLGRPSSGEARLALYLVAVVLSAQRHFGPAWLVTGDLVLGVAIVLTALHLSRDDRIRLPSWYPATSLVLAAAVVSIVVNASAPHFSGTEALRSLAKLALYLAGAAGVSMELRGAERALVARLLRCLLLASAAVVVVQHALHAVNLRVPILPSIGRTEWDYASALPRAFGFYSEPATMAAFLVVIGCALMQISGIRPRDATALLVGIGLSGSLSGVALLMVLFVLAFVHGRRSGFTRVRLAVGLTALVMAAIASSRSVRETLDARVISRVTATLDRSDASGSGRLFDSWVAARAVASPRPVTGVGIGQQGSVLTGLWTDGSLTVDSRLVDVGGGWNVFANTYAEMGMLGLTALIAVIVMATKQKNPGLVILVLVGFATGTILGWAWWCSLALLAYGPVRQSTESSRGQTMADRHRRRSPGDMAANMYTRGR